MCLLFFFFYVKRTKTRRECVRMIRVFDVMFSIVEIFNVISIVHHFVFNFWCKYHKLHAIATTLHGSSNEWFNTEKKAHNANRSKRKSVSHSNRIKLKNKHEFVQLEKACHLFFSISLSFSLFPLFYFKSIRRASSHFANFEHKFN